MVLCIAKKNVNWKKNFFPHCNIPANASRINVSLNTDEKTLYDDLNAIIL